MNTKRLNILADFLDSIPPEFAFNLQLWGHHDGIQNPDPDRMESILYPHDLTNDDAKFLFVECGYSACAIGHACMSHELRAEGLDFIIQDGNITPTFKGVDGWNAVIQFFGLPEGRASFLFDEDSYESNNTTAKEVATRIREYLLK